MRITSRLNPVLKLILGIAACNLVSPLSAQTNPCAPKQQYDVKNWRRIPQILNAHPDTVSAPIRKARDEYFAAEYPSKGLYGDLDGLRGSSIAGNSYPKNYPDRYWVVGTFVNFDIHEVPGKTIYTEIHLRIDRLIGRHQAKPNQPGRGSIVDIGIGGGCLVTGTGEVRDFLTYSYTARVRPDHRYILELARTEIDGLYRMGVLADITDGTAQPVEPSQKSAAEQGEWLYLNLTEQAAVERLEAEDPNN